MSLSGNKPLFGRLETVGIAAPASPCGRRALLSGVKFLRGNGVKAVVAPNVFRKGTFSYLSSDDDRRAEDFNSLAEDPSIDAILCARGGYGTPRILDRIRYDLLRERNLPVIGFSDITALHLAMLSRNAGICVASRMCASLSGVSSDPVSSAGMRRVYSLLSGRPGAFRKFGRKLVAEGSVRSVSGKLVPMNLSLAAALCGTGYLPSMEDRIAVLEEVGEPVRKIDRMLNQLLYSGFFSGASAVVFAQFSDCGKSRERNALFRDFSVRSGLPVFTGLCYGHDSPSLSFLFDEPCRIENGVFLVQG